jgi:hypothetical protein
MSGTSVPYLQQFIPGQGVIPAAWLNTVVQGGCYLANLRSFVGIPNQTVQMIGFTAQNDGGQGTFVWSTNVGTDDGGVSTIVPNGVVQGCWIRQVPGYIPMPSLTGTVVPVATVAALRALTTSVAAGPLIYLEGYFAGSDGGEGVFWLDASDTTSDDDGGTIFVDANERRWYRETSGATTNIQWFGGNPSVTDCTSAYTAALASFNESGSLFFPAGTYTFLSSPAFTYPTGPFGLTLLGDGADVSILYWPTGSGLSFAANSPLHSIHLRDLTFSTAGSANSSVGVSLTNNIQGGNFAQNDVYRVTFRGADGGAQTDYWNTGLAINGWGNFAHDSCVFYGPANAGAGIGVALAGVPSGAFQYSLIHNFSKCSWFNEGEGLVYGNYVQGVTLDQCNFTNGTTDVLIPAGAVGCVQLAISNSQFAGIGERILLNGPIATVLLSNNVIFVEANQIGIAFNAIYGQVCITGNNFSGSSIVGNFGVNVNATGYTCTIVGNAFYGLANGVNLAGATTGGWIVALNNYQGCVNQVINIGSNAVGIITS